MRDAVGARLTVAGYALKLNRDVIRQVEISAYVDQKSETESSLQFLGALDGADALNAANAEDHAVEVAQVLRFDNEFDDGLAVVVVVDIDAANVGVVV